MKLINIKLMKKVIFFLIALTFIACDLNEEPISSVYKDPVFKSENGLKLYTNSFYSILPSASAQHKKDEMCDYAARTEVPDFIRKDAYGPQQSTGWDWKDLRNINYFIQNCNSPEVPQIIRNNYIGLARFFRAYFYFEKVVRFGNVPWINKAMDSNDPDLYAKRDSRTLVMDSILADLNFACENITLEKETTGSLITKYVALAYKSRVCLFEGTFRKYHLNYNLSGTADFWLKEAETSAKLVMDKSGFSIHKADENKSYRDLFISAKTLNTEVMLASVCDEAQSVFNDANWWWTSATYGRRISLIRTFVNTYLNIDGTPFTDNPNYKTMVFSEETKNRDKRLQQTIRLGDYKRINDGVIIPAPPVFSYTYTGYQPIKFTLDDVYFDSGNKNYNTIPLIRYAEVLLNYAEARAETHNFTEDDWKVTVGELRSRAGITGGLSKLPTKPDEYLRTNYFPEINDPVLLEIRRERGIELVFEGLRLNDLIRWKKGNLMEMEWNGFYVPELDVLMDLNEDNIPDVCFTQKGTPGNPVEGVTYINVATKISNNDNPQLLSEGIKGEITWLNNIPRKWEEKHYLYPIPELVILMNPNLLPQNPGWGKN